jgi:2-polyprenyl-3-methyl-5-hydroxy-6-metoxy-1,4-benzoquinol methylase
MRNPALQWERFGREDPYYGVYSVDEFRRPNLDDAALGRFFASGEQHVASVLDAVGRLAAPGFAPDSVLDHGCGVGRLLIPFAERATRAVGVDVSPSMLEEARRNCERRGLGHVELVPAGDMAALGPSFDLVHSFIVLQHVPRREGERIFDTLAGLVRPGGVGVVHVPIAARHPSAVAHTLVTRHVPYATNLANLLRRRAWSYPHMQMNVYRLNALVARLMRRGFEDAHLRFDPADGGRGSYDACLLIFRRPER